jgi:5-formyltetrahydrofolate cyclo-ligase
VLVTAEPADPSIVEAKRRLREAMASRRLGIAPGVAAAAGEAVARFVGEAPEVLRARRIALYAAAPGELPTRSVFERLVADDRPMLLPRARGGSLEWALVQDWDGLVPGRFGVPEPRGPEVSAPGPGDVALLPCLALDLAGWRLGRGAGFYDRAFPASRPGPLLVGSGFEFQRVEVVPHDSRDRRVDAIVTERGWRWCREEG